MRTHPSVAGIARFARVAALFACFGGACVREPERARNAQTLGPEDAERGITKERLLAHIGVLASDAFEGRAPGTPGETKTVSYLTTQLRDLGLSPGNPDGSYVQPVPLVGVTSTATATYERGGAPVTLRMPDDLVVGPRGAVADVALPSSDVVFCGYGVVAPEYGWDDYAGIDVRGKTVLVLVNEPQIRDPKDPSKLDDAMFAGRAMTYYGRYGYKYEAAAAKGAAAVLVVHEDDAAGYPWSVVTSGFGRENFKIAHFGAEPKMLQGWLTQNAARRIFSASERDYDAAKQAAGRRGFTSVQLGGAARFAVRSALRQVQSTNVVARLPGSDPLVASEHVVYTAHWDHLGRDDNQKPDPIYNGAVDNASGVATLLEIARAFAVLRPAPRRSVLFLATTAEEKGLLGAEYYAEHPLYGLASALAAINMDSMNVWGRTTAVQDAGGGGSTLDDVVVDEARAQGRTVRADEHPEIGAPFRSDQFPFVKRGVPGIFLGSAGDYVGRSSAWAAAHEEDLGRISHHPIDEVRPDWDLAGAVLDAQLDFRVGWRVTQSDARPTWKPGAPSTPGSR